MHSTTPLWFDREALEPPLPAFLVGVLEMPRIGEALALELHVLDAGDGATLGVWLDEHGRPLRVVRAGEA